MDCVKWKEWQTGDDNIGVQGVQSKFKEWTTYRVYATSEAVHEEGSSGSQPKEGGIKQSKKDDRLASQFGRRCSVDDGCK